MRAHELPIWDTGEVITHDALFSDPKFRTQNRWMYETPKTGQMLALVGTLRFVLAVLLTGDPTVKVFSTVCEKTTYPGQKGKTLSVAADFAVELKNGEKQWITTMERIKHDDATELRVDTLRKFAEGKGVEHRLFLKSDIKKRAIEFDNWALLSARMNCADAKRFSLHHERTVLGDILKIRRAVRLEELLDADQVDRARMLAVVGYGLMNGLLSTNLTTSLISLDSLISYS
ncbi:hypothetical protein PQR33_22725 [Paraburkholderia sediminicola]|uniref:hypothetical protein n=1 Tax=Paraburkholderia sediminicola TaxID=458836 RepID=UPI0038B83BE6